MNRRLAHSVIRGLLRLIVSAVFLWAALPKLLDPASFAIDIAAYQLTGAGLSLWIAIALPWTELAAAIGLLAPWTRRASGLLLCGLLLLFIGLHLSAWARGLDIACGCFGKEAADFGSNYPWLLSRNPVAGCRQLGTPPRPAEQFDTSGHLKHQQNLPAGNQPAHSPAMPRLTHVPALTLIALISGLSSLHASILVWDRTEARIEMQPDQTEVRATFKVTNQGEETLRIGKIKASCGCTGSVINQRILAPGQSTAIEAVFNKGKRKGKNQTHLTVFLDGRRCGRHAAPDHQHPRTRQNPTQYRLLERAKRGRPALHPRPLG